MLNGCFYILLVRVRMGRAHCTWQLSMGGSRGHRPSFRMVSFGACSIPLQKCRHFRGCSFQFWPRMSKDCSEGCSTLRQILTWSCFDISHSTVSSQVKILLLNKIPCSSSWQWSGWSVVILNLKTRVQSCGILSDKRKAQQTFQNALKSKKSKSF